MILSVGQHIFRRKGYCVVEIGTTSPGVNAMKFANTNMIFATSLLTAVCLIALPSEAQQDAEAQPASGSNTDLSFKIHFGFENSLDADLNEGGDLEVFRIRAGVTGKSSLSQSTDYSVSLDYGVDLYNFDGVTGFGGVDPWEDIHTFGVTVIFTTELSNEWTVFGGPVFQFSREDNADLGDSFIGGGLIGFSYQVDSDLTVGGGFGIVTQIEDDSRLFPVFVINWQLTDDLLLTSNTSAGATGKSGVELVYDIGNGWEAGIGGYYEFIRFRLDEEGIAPNGVGEELRIPIQARLSAKLGDYMDVDFYAGLTISSQVELADSTGVLLGSDDLDPAAIVGVMINLSF